MMAGGHLLGAPVFVFGIGLAVNSTTGLTGFEIDPGQVIAAAVASVPFSAGPLSPDADQTWLSRLGHRYATHWYGWPLAVLGGLAVVGAPFAVFGPALGWLSHIWPWDWLFGKGGRHIPHGIPAWPIRPLRYNAKGQRVRGKRYGVGLRVSANTKGWRKIFGEGRRHSVLEWTTMAAFVPLLWWEVWALGGIIG